MSHSSYSHRF